MRKYIQVIDDLEISLNFRSTNERKAKNNKRLFSLCLNELKDDYKTDVSTKYLMSFVIGDEKQKSNRVAYMLKEIGLKERKRVSICYIEGVPTTTSKEVDILVYKSKEDLNGVEEISVKSFPLTSHQPYFKKLDNGKVVNMGLVKMPCKVGIISRKLKQITLHQIVI